MKYCTSMLAALCVGVFLAAAAPAVGHHSFAAEYDRNKPVTLTGPVTKVEWMNPHVFFYMDVTGADGKVANWAIELANPASLYRRGWKKEALRIGGTAVVQGSLAKDGSHLANASAVTLDGKRLFAGSSGDDNYDGR